MINKTKVESRQQCFMIDNFLVAGTSNGPTQKDRLKRWQRSIQQIVAFVEYIEGNFMRKTTQVDAH